MDKTDNIEINEADDLEEEINRRMPHQESLEYLLAVLECHRFIGDKTDEGIIGLDRRVKALALRSGETLSLLVKSEGGIHHPEFLGRDRQRHTLFEACYKAGQILVETKIGQQKGTVYLTIKELLSRLPFWIRIKRIFTPH